MLQQQQQQQQQQQTSPHQTVLTSSAYSTATRFPSMAKNKRTTKDAHKGNTKKKTIAGVGGKSQHHRVEDVSTTTTDARLVRLFPLDDDQAMEYLVTMVIIFAVAMWIGFSVGVGWIGVGWDEAWRLRVANGLRATTVYQLATLQPTKWQEIYIDSLQSAA